MVAIGRFMTNYRSNQKLNFYLIFILNKPGSTLDFNDYEITQAKLDKDFGYLSYIELR